MSVWRNEVRRTMNKLTMIPLAALALTGATAANAQLMGNVTGQIDATARGTLNTPAINAPDAGDIAERRADYAKRQAEAAKQRAERRAENAREDAQALAERRKEWAANQAERAADRVEVPEGVEAGAAADVEASAEASAEPRG